MIPKNAILSNFNICPRLNCLGYIHEATTYKDYGMAKMKRIDLGSLALGIRVKVGNNREIEKVDPNTYHGYLHGNHIFTCQELGEITLSTEGWHTVTTRQALNDFLGYFGYPHKVSLAQGRLTVFALGRVCAEGESTVSFTG